MVKISTANKLLSAKKGDPFVHFRKKRKPSCNSNSREKIRNASKG